MSDVAFVFSNPRHHLEMMMPVAEELERRNVRCTLVSLAELRGFETPRQSGAHRVIPFNLRRRPQTPADPGGDDTTWRRGSLAKRLVWQVGLAPRLRWMLHRARAVVVPNDAVYPYVELVAQLRKAGTRTILLQEGIRFQMPERYTGPQYGGGVSAAVCAWGEGSKDFFVAGRVPEHRIVVTGAPRLDDLDPAAWRARGQELLGKLALKAAPIVFMSNPIEQQGYGSKDGKLALFARFLAGAAPVLRRRNIAVLVTNHLQENPSEYARVAAQSPIPELVTIIERTPTFAAIAAARAAVVLTSTVGLEALTFGVPLGVLEIPGHDFAFEYVQRGAAVPIRMASIADGIEALLDPDEARINAGNAFVRRHLHDRGRARYNVADVIERVVAGERQPDGPGSTSEARRGPWGPDGSTGGAGRSPVLSK
jgi:hypothetical protein